MRPGSHATIEAKGGAGVAAVNPSGFGIVLAASSNVAPMSGPPN